ncbi:MAG: glycosyltransferase family 2 protein [Lachnospiraceae bacterium]|nr:glycosyltransferase family 2 protein [Lachnospiraceae bacterium]
MLSVIIPSYNEEKIIKKTAETITSILRDNNIEYEIIFVNDGSSDGTWTVIEQLSYDNPDIKGVCFSRNFGKESAIFAGLAECIGDACVVIDCDLQHPPEKIPEMYKLWKDGYEIVEGVKSYRGEEKITHSLAANRFYKIMSKETGTDMSDSSDYKLLDRKVINTLLNMPEKNTFFRALSSWVGFKKTSVRYDVAKREGGESKWSRMSLIKYALSNITSFTTRPMYIILYCGIAVLIMGIVLSIIALVQKFTGNSIGGFTTVIILLCFTSSVIMLSIGVIGYYIAKIYEEVKGRPRYIISSKTEVNNRYKSESTTEKRDE